MFKESTAHSKSAMAIFCALVFCLQTGVLFFTTTVCVAKNAKNHSWHSVYSSDSLLGHVKIPVLSTTTIDTTKISSSQSGLPNKIIDGILYVNGIAQNQHTPTTIETKPSTSSPRPYIVDGITYYDSNHPENTPNNTTNPVLKLESSSTPSLAKTTTSLVQMPKQVNNAAPRPYIVDGVTYYDNNHPSNTIPETPKTVYSEQTVVDRVANSTSPSHSNYQPQLVSYNSTTTPAQPSLASTAVSNSQPITYSSYGTTPTRTPSSGPYNTESEKLLLANLYGEDIPCNAHYGYSWNTSRIHHYKFNLTQMPQSVEFFLTHGLDDDFKMPSMGYVTSNFGPRHRRHHNGIDIKLQKGDPVYAAFEGKVRIAQYSRSYGYVIVVRHFNGLETLYAHLSKLKVKPDDVVKAGTVIGLGGNTGRSTGSHLHFEVRYKGHPLNPNEMIDFNTKQLKNHTFTVDKAYFSSSTPYESSHGGGTATASASGSSYHKVRRGDTLGKIAKRHGTSVSRICKLNRISSRTTLRVGRSLRVR